MPFRTVSKRVGEYDVDIRQNDKLDPNTIIFVHGIGVSEKYFRRLADLLDLADFDVRSINLPGFGETKKPSHSLSINQLTAVVEKYILQEDIRNPVLVGHSMGCQIVARLSRSHALSLGKIILLSPTINRYERTPLIQLIRLLQDTFYEPFRMNVMIMQDYLKFGVIRYLQTQRYMIADKIEEPLALCDSRVVIVRGEKDKIVPCAWTQFLMQIIPNGIYAEVKGGPHNFQYTHPQEVAALCIDFIRQ